MSLRLLSSPGSSQLLELLFSILLAQLIPQSPVGLDYIFTSHLPLDCAIISNGGDVQVPGRGRPFQKGHVPHNKQPEFEFVCEVCGKVFARPLWYLEKIGVPRTCSRVCHNRRLAKEAKETKRLKGSNNPQWRGGISVIYYRRLFEEVLPKKCQICGNDKHLVVHHKDGNRRNNNIENLVVMCKSCHQREHKAHLNFSKRDEVPRV